MLQVGVGFLAQYIIKPLLGFVIALVKFYWLLCILLLKEFLLYTI